MSTLEQAEDAVTKMSRSELTAFRTWFIEFDGDAWDAQIEADAAAGKLDMMAKEALAEYHAGKCREI